MTPHSSLDLSRRRHPSGLSTPQERFAHQSEHVFARLLNLYGLAWCYEPIEFPIGWDEHGRAIRGFRPDFYLPDQRLFIELTVLEQRLVTKKNQKIRLFRHLYPEIELVVVYQRDFMSLVERHHVGLTGDAAA